MERGVLEARSSRGGGDSDGSGSTSSSPQQSRSRGSGDSGNAIAPALLIPIEAAPDVFVKQGKKNESQQALAPIKKLQSQPASRSGNFK